MNRQIIATIILLFFSAFVYAESGIAPVNWDNLTIKQQKILKSVKSKWPEMDIVQQRRLLKGASRWATLDKRERKIAAEKFKQFRAMTSQRRANLRMMYRNYNKLPESEKTTLHAARKRFNNYSASKKAMLRKKWDSMTQLQRQEFIKRRLIRLRQLQLQNQTHRDRTSNSVAQ